MKANIEVLIHSSIRIGGEKVIYADPFRVKDKLHDADLILITHDHYDHFSREDIDGAAKEKTILVVPENMKKQAIKAGFAEEKLVTVKPGSRLEIDGVGIEAVAAYNKYKPFHPKSKGWTGYLVSMAGETIYIAGDTDLTEESRKVKCDIAMVPIGGTYTMDARKAAELVNHIRPKTAVPTHYGSVVGKREDEDVFRKYVDPEIRVEIRMRQQEG